MKKYFIISLVCASFLYACGEDTSVDTSSNAGTMGTAAGNTAGDTAGATAGISAGTTAGTAAGTGDVPLSGTTAGATAGTNAGTTAGTNAGTTAGTNAGTTAGTDAGTTTVDPVDDAGVCFQSCLALLSCETNITDGCGYQTQSSWVSSCQLACSGAQANDIKTSAAQGCDMAQGLLSLLGLTCTEDLACETECSDGQRCRNGACMPWTCSPDQFDAQNNNEQATASMLNFAPQSLQNLTLCSDDTDWYQMDVPAGSSLRIDIAFLHQDGDIDVSLYIDDGTSPAISSLGSTNNERITLIPSENDRRIYIKVTLFRSSYNPTPEDPDAELNPRVAESEYSLLISTDLPAPICQRSDDCQEDYLCISSNVCIPPPPCTSDEDCYDGVCDLNTGTCLDCFTNDDCYDGVCDVNNNSCVDCMQNTDCNDGHLCEPSMLSCVECYEDSHCNDGICNEQNRCVPNGCVDMLEPNDDRDTAHNVATNTILSGLYLCGDRDWYTFNLNGGENILISILFSDVDGDIDAKLYNINGEQVVSRISNTDNEYLGLVNAPAGQYFLEVYVVGSANNTYSLEINTNTTEPVCATNDDCVEGTCDTRNTSLCLPEGYCSSHRDCMDNTVFCNLSNNQCDPCRADQFGMSTEMSAVSLMPGNYTMLNLCGGDDFYSIQAGAGQTIRVTTTFIHMMADLDIQLLDSNMTVVARSLDTDDDESIEFMVETAGTYLLKIYTIGRYYQEYDVSVQVQ